ncbi:MAG: hypothetical protein ACYCQK_05230 [Acidiferrobacteraceae bacterium]
MNQDSRRLSDYPLAELKLFYVALRQALAREPALMDCDLLQDLQRLLQRAAGAAHIDATDHAAWERWLHSGSSPQGSP